MPCHGHHAYIFSTMNKTGRMEKKQFRNCYLRCNEREQIWIVGVFFSRIFFVFISKSLESCRLKKSTQNWKHVKSSNANKDTLFRYVHLHTYISNMSLQLYSIPNIVQNKNSFKICYVLACLLEESKTRYYRAHVHYILLCTASP